MMSAAIKIKIRVTKSVLRVILFKKMKQKSLGTAGMEKYLMREVRDPSERSKVRRRLLAFKVSNALREETFVRKQFEKRRSRAS